MHKMRRVLSRAVACSPGGAKPGMRSVGLFLKAGLSVPGRGADVLLAEVALVVAQHDQAGGGLLAHDAQIRAVVRSCTGPGRAGHPYDVAVRA